MHATIIYCILNSANLVIISSTDFGRENIILGLL